ncbi:cyclin-dependent kinase 12-like isoform X4 [Trematomus bernacchii]|uniref:cyclin-dependent kinase 12-like isoform X4 n=1 Tax=Trematomus bernacchii TaxID=40690 RepID=UPI00146E233C|nr:cyclin-dependent kinase 12-like isoform X4 [Trematomus bernacchii]
MQSNRSQYSNRRQYSDRSSRNLDDYEDKWEERGEPQRDKLKDSYQKYGGNGHGSKERTSRSTEFSDSPKMIYSKDWSGKSSARRGMSSPEQGAPKKRRQFTEDDKDYRYRHEPEDTTPNSFSRAHVNKDFKRTPSLEEDFKYRKTPQDSKQRYRHEESSYRKQHDDCRQSSGYYKDRDDRERSRDGSQERTQSQDPSTKSYAAPGERNDSPSTHHEDYRQTRFPVNGSSGQSFESDVTTHSAAVPEKSTMGFQRFLEVLNKGVNVDTLTQIVTRSSPEEDGRPQSPTSFTKTDNPWSPGYAGRQQESHWSKSNGPQRRASLLPPHQSFSPKRCPLSDEESLQRGECSNSRSRSLPVVEKITLTPEEEHKHRQMQDVLLAIGMDLGSDELGQMSHRIQERLYGKKDTDGRPLRRASRERETKRAVSPRHQGRSSSSSRSSFSPSLREYYNQKDLYSARRDKTEVDQVQVQETVDYAQNSSSSALQQSEKCQTYSQDSNAACQPIPQNPAYNYPPPTPAMPMYPPVNSSPLPYPALPPNMPHFRPGLFMPRPPPFFPYPSVPPMNIFPGVLPQMRHLLPQNMGNPPYFNTFQPLNITQRKTITRTRCLQVIDTKQPG